MAEIEPMDASSSQTRVLMALVTLQEEGAVVTVRKVSARAGLSVSPTHRHLRQLRRQGLVTWVDGLQGTLRATVQRVR